MRGVLGFVWGPPPVHAQKAECEQHETWRRRHAQKLTRAGARAGRWREGDISVGVAEAGQDDERTHAAVNERAVLLLPMMGVATTTTTTTTRTVRAPPHYCALVLPLHCAKSVAARLK